MKHLSLSLLLLISLATVSFSQSTDKVKRRRLKKTNQISKVTETSEADSLKKETEEKFLETISQAKSITITVPDTRDSVLFLSLIKTQNEIQSTHKLIEEREFLLEKESKKLNFFREQLEATRETLKPEQITERELQLKSSKESIDLSRKNLINKKRALESVESTFLQKYENLKQKNAQ